jgi:hypothetical protein
MIFLIYHPLFQFSIFQNFKNFKSYRPVFDESTKLIQTDFLSVCTKTGPVFINISIHANDHGIT